jgi:hypothetical protein
MGYGNGWFWHRYFDFPNLPRVTKTITLSEKRGYPYAILKIGKTVYNHVALHNGGIYEWLEKYKLSNRNDVILSLAGSDAEIDEILSILHWFQIKTLRGIELNFSCPNVKCNLNKRIPPIDIPLYLKLNHKQDPYQYDLSGVTSIRVNSVPCKYGGKSGKGAQKENWNFIKKFNSEGLKIAGSSFTTMDDIKYLEEYCGCEEIGIGSTILINPKLVETLSLI